MFFSSTSMILKETHFNKTYRITSDIIWPYKKEKEKWKLQKALQDVLHTKHNLFVIKMRFSSSIYHHPKICECETHVFQWFSIKYALTKHKRWNKK